MRPRVALLLLPFLALSLACSEDGGPGPGPIVPDPYPDATTADILIDNFVRAYEEMNFSEYSKLIHDEFEFFFSDTDVVKLGLDSAGWNRFSELGATQNIFQSQPGIDLDGKRVPGIVKIAMRKLDDTVAEWLPAQGDPLFDGTSVRRYRFNIDLTHNGESNPVAVHGIEEFYVEQVEVDGQLIFQLKFWKDFGTPSKSSNDPDSWGTVKSIFSQ